MLRARQEVPLSPSWPSIEVRELRARLILEECLETIAALGVTLSVTCEDSGFKYQKAITFKDIKRTGQEMKGTREELIEIVDGCCDVAVVTTGTLSAFGVGDMLVQGCVNDNNLAKFRPGHRIDEGGKLIKPPDHKAPKLGELIFGDTAYDAGPGTLLDAYSYSSGVVFVAPPNLGVQLDTH